MPNLQSVKHESASPIRLSHHQWTSQEQDHILRLSPFVNRYRNWKKEGKKHPVYDFLFSYYSFSGGELLRWSPGLGIICETPILMDKSELAWSKFIRTTEHTYYIDPLTFPKHRIEFLNWTKKYLKSTQERPPIFHCFGLHEWAMVYQTKSIQHPDTPLRLPERDISELVESLPLCCTHYDAFRFFSTSATPLNRHQLKRTDVVSFEQAGCIHANMDLYRLGYKVAPFISSNLLGDLFILAKKAREIDMRASPYDLSEYDLSPIKIETKEGREEYVSLQRQIHQESIQLRASLLSLFEKVHQEVSMC